VTGRKIHGKFLEGYIGLIDIKQVSEVQRWKFNGVDIVVCNSGYKWLSILPKDDFYCITAMMNEKGDILLWYIDMIAGQGIDKDGVPYFYDLYLDLVIYPNGDIVVDDMDELEEALNQNEISLEQYHLALDTADKLKNGLLSNMDLFENYTRKCYEVLE